MKTKLSIIKRNHNDGNSSIIIEIKDSNSGIKIIETEVSLFNFSEAITGLSRTTCTSKVTTDFNKIGKFKKTKYFLVPKSLFEKNAYDLEKRHQVLIAYLELNEDYQTLADNGWSLYNDGLNSQQNYEYHNIILVKYDEKE